MSKGEAFPPAAFNAPHGTVGWLNFGLRLLMDVRVGNIWRFARRSLPHWSGLVGDVGCGDGPWKWLLSAGATYIGVDVPRADSAFGYARKRRSLCIFDGVHFPFADGSFSHCLCTEVLEHVEKPGLFLAECCRVTRDGGSCFFSVPFAARYHYIPFDYWRFTPTALRRLFEEAGWADVQIVPLGTDVTVAAYKVNALILRLAFGDYSWLVLSPFRLLAIILSPLFLLLTAVQWVSALLSWGSDSDPLGYVVTACRPRE